MKEELITVERRVLEMIKPEGFIQMFLSIRQKEETNHAAYDATERIHLEYYGATKYSSYHSFKVILSRYNKALS